MKKPDEIALQFQREHRESIKSLESQIQALQEKLRETRRRLANSFEISGDVEIAMAGWERAAAFKNRIIPEKTPEDIEWFENLKKKNAIDIRLACHSPLNWWESVDEKGNPVPFPIRLNIEDFPTLAHVAVEVGAFSSLTDARKNGKNQKSTLGEHRFKGKFGGMIRVILE